MGRESVSLRSLVSEDLNQAGKLEVTAEVVIDDRDNKLMEEIVSHLSLEQSVSAARWEVSYVNAG